MFRVNRFILLAALMFAMFGAAPVSAQYNELTGSAADDWMLDNANENDIINSGSGDDFIITGRRRSNADDAISSGADIINAGSDNDKISIVAGSNDITGGSGNDVFVIYRAVGTTNRITDFEVSNPDEKIDLSNIKNPIVSFTQQGFDVNINIARTSFANSQILILENTDITSLKAENFVGYSDYNIPIAINDDVTVNKNIDTVIDPLVNDIAIVDNPLVIDENGVSNGTNGSAFIDGSGQLIYRPNINFTGSDSFTYRIKSGGASVYATVNVTVN